MEFQTQALPIELIATLVLVLTEAVKRVLKKVRGVQDLDPAVAPVTALLLGMLLNTLNVLLFTENLTVGLLREAARVGILAAAAAAGFWSAGRNLMKPTPPVEQ